jgi:hypothetical protein
MPITCAEIEERVLEAYEELETQEKPNIAKTAREFDVPVGRLRPGCVGSGTIERYIVVGGRTLGMQCSTKFV